MQDAPLILHLHSTFDLGGKEARTVQLINAFGDRFRHHIVSASPNAFGAMDLIDPHLDVRACRDFPPLAGPMDPRRIRAIGQAVRTGGYDLVLTYNFGAMDGVLATNYLTHVPLVHHEDGFNEDEIARPNRWRSLYRRLALRGAKGVVVPSRTLERIARTAWGQPAKRVTHIPNGVPAKLYAQAPSPDAIPGLHRTPDERIIGTLAGLRPVKNLPRLVRACAIAMQACPDISARLVIIGNGPERDRIAQAAASAGIADRLLLPGFLPNPHLYVGLFDIFALSSDSEQFPLSLVEAMAAAVPAVVTDVGDVREILPETEQAYAIAPCHETDLARLFIPLMRDADLRHRLGQANRRCVMERFDFDRMQAHYLTLYEGAMTRKGG